MIGLDIRASALEQARALAAKQGCADRCEFITSSHQPVDAVVSIDAFEHFAEPQAILAHMHHLLKPGGIVAASFGPNLYDPLGGHLFDFPLGAPDVLRSGADPLALRHSRRRRGPLQRCRGRPESDDDPALRAHREAKPVSHQFLEQVPIRKLRWLHNPLTREFTTAVVRCVLVR